MPQSRRLCDGRALPRKTGIFRGTAAFEEPMNQAETPPKTVTACVLIIGNEILSGRTPDANLAFLAKGLNEAGIRLREARVIPDDAETIVNTVNEVRRVFDYVFTTGGIGPTHDDITSASIAEAFAVPLIVHPEAKRLLESHYPPGRLNEARLRMAQVPDGATLLPNPISRAPGFRIDNVFVLPGVPQIMQAIFSELKHRLKGGAAVLSRSVSCTLAEGTIAKDLGELQTRYADLEIGSYPYFRGHARDPRHRPGAYRGGGRGIKDADPLPRRRSAGRGSGGIRAIGGRAAATKKLRAGAFSRCPGISLRREQPAREIRTGAQ